MGTTPSRSRAFVAASFQYLGIGTAPVTAPPMTLACFTKPTALAAIIPIALSHPAPSLGWFQILQNADGTAYAYQYDGTNFGLALSAGVVTAGRWNHLCAVFTSNSSRAMFINGANKGTSTTAVTTAALTQFCIGIEPNTGGYYNGNIAGVAVWNVALTDAEVAMLASGISPLRIQRSSLVFFAPDGETNIIGTALTNNGPTASQADPADVTWTINAVDRTSFVRRYESSIELTADGTPDNATFLVRGFTPTVGQSVSVLYHNELLFSGEITDVELIVARASARAQYRCQAIDSTFLLNRRLVCQSWSATAAETIIANILTNFTSGFTRTNVQSGLTAIDFVAVLESVSSVLQRLADAVGAKWKMRPDKDLYFRTTTNLTAPVTFDTGNLLIRNFRHHYNDDQMRNMVDVKGAGTSLVAPAAVGQDYVGLVDSSVFSSSGGKALALAQLLTYTGRVLGGTLAAPVVIWGALTPVAGGSLTAGITYKFVLTFITLAGETVKSNVGTASAATTAVNKQFNASWSVSNPYSSATFLGLYVSDDGGTTWKVSNTALPSANTYQTVIPVASTSVGTPPVTSTAGNEVNTGSTTTGVVAIGSTTIPVAATEVFNDAGGIAAYTVYGVNYTVRYTGRSTIGLGGNLTGVPASGVGSVQVAIPSGASISNIAGLTGIPTSSTGSIVAALAAGDPVNLIVQRSDATSQTAMAVLEGGDGIHEFLVSDTSLDTASACNTRGDAELTLGKNIVEAASLTSQDQYAIPGATQAFSILGFSASLTIAAARIFWERTRRNPQRDVTLTSQRKTLYQYLNDLQRQAAK